MLEEHVCGGRERLPIFIFIIFIMLKVKQSARLIHQFIVCHFSTLNGPKKLLKWRDFAAFPVRLSSEM